MPPVPTAAGASPQAGKWRKRIGALLAFAVLGLFVLAIPHIVAGFPWLALLVALPLLL